MRGDSPSAAATSFIVRPSAISRTTSRWRGVSARASEASLSDSVVRTSWSEIRRQVRPAPEDGLDGGDELLPGRVLHDETGRARAERLGRKLGVGMHGQEDHLGGDRVGLEPTQCLQPAHAGHGHVGHDDVGPESPGRLEQLGPVRHGPTRENSLPRRLASPSATTAWSSASSRSRAASWALGQRHHDAEGGTALRLGVDREAAPRETDALVEADQAKAVSASRIRRSKPRPSSLIGEH